MDWIMQTLTQLGEHFGLVLIACVELAAAVALLIKGQHKKEGTPIQTARGRGARDLLLQELDRRSDQVFILMRRSDLMPIAAVGNTQKMLGHQPGRTSDQPDDADAADGEPGRE